MGHTGDYCPLCTATAFTPWLRGHGLEAELVRLAVHIDAHVRAVQDFAIEDLDGERVLDHALQRTLERTRAVGCIGTRARMSWRADSVSSSEMARLQAACHVVEAQVENVAHLRGSERAEDHDIVDAVEELGPEVLAQDAHDGLASHV